MHLTGLDVGLREREGPTVTLRFWLELLMDGGGFAFRNTRAESCKEL